MNHLLSPQSVKWLLSFMTCCLFLSIPSLQAASYRQETISTQQPETASISQNSSKSISPETLSYVALGMSVAGLTMIWLPVVSLLGLILSIGGLGLGILLRKKLKKSRARQLAVSLGMLAVISTLVVFGLVLFF